MRILWLLPLVLGGQFLGSPGRIVVTAPDGGAPVVEVQAPIEVKSTDGGVEVSVNGRVEVNSTDGGLEVYIPGRVSSTVSMEPGTFLAVAGDTSGTRLSVEVTGTAGAPVAVTGPAGGPVISELGQQTANLITNPSCSFGVPQITTVTTTPTLLPSVAEGHAEPTTKWALLNLSNSRRVCCMGIQADGGLPDCTTKGYVAMPGGGTINIDGEQSLNVYCRTDSMTAQVNVWEASCVQ